MLIKLSPVAVAENTINNRVPAVTGILKPVAIAELNCPIESGPGKGMFTSAPLIGEKMLVEGAAD